MLLLPISFWYSRQGVFFSLTLPKQKTRISFLKDISVTEEEYGQRGQPTQQTIQSNPLYLPQNTACSCIDYLIMFLPQESSHSPAASWETPFFTAILGVLSCIANLSLFWLCCARRAVLGGCRAQVHWDFITVFLCGLSVAEWAAERRRYRGS